MMFALLFQREIIRTGMFTCHNHNIINRGNATYEQKIYELMRTAPAQSDYAVLG